MRIERKRKRMRERERERGFYLVDLIKTITI